MFDKPAAREAQAATAIDTITIADAGSEKLSQAESRAFTRAIFANLDVIAADRELPSPAFRVAYVISQHLNKKTREAFVGTDLIASKAALSKSTVRAMVEKLRERGHYVVEFGRQGR